MGKRDSNVKALRESAKARLARYQGGGEDDDNAIYDEVDDESYRKIVQKRILEEDFVVDDNGEGYLDNGTDEWDRPNQYDSFSEEEDSHRGKGTSKGKKNDPDADGGRKEKSINRYFGRAPAVALAKPKVVTSAKDDEDFLDSLLGNLDSSVPKPAAHSKKRHQKISPTSDFDFQLHGPNSRTNVSSSPPSLVRNSAQKIRIPSSPTEGLNKRKLSTLIDESLNDTQVIGLDEDDFAISQSPAEDTPTSSSPPKKVKAEAKSESDHDDDKDEDLMTMKPLVAAKSNKSNDVNLNAVRKRVEIRKSEPMDMSKTPQAKMSTQLESSQEDSSWINLHTKINSSKGPSIAAVSSSPAKVNRADYEEENGTVRMFWTDYTEVFGKLILFGKTKLKKDNKYVSSMLQVTGINRSLFFLPRTEELENGDQGPVEMEKVYEEVAQLMKSIGVKEFLAKPVTKKYAFELPGVPAETEYLHVLYSFEERALPQEILGKSFARVFGSHSTQFEEFVLTRNIMGPCWLEIKEPNFESVNGASWTKADIAVIDPDNVSPISDDVDVPPLNLMSIAVRTVVNPKVNKREIVTISGRLFQNILHDTTVPAEKIPSTAFTIVRPINQIYPSGFESAAKAYKQGTIIVRKSEEQLLNSFLDLLASWDPDVIVGHNLESIDLSIILHRLKEKKISLWSRVGRLRRSTWPQNFGKSSNGFTEKQIAAGRLLADLANDMGKSLMSKCQSWSLTEMCQVILGKENRRLDIEEDVSKSDLTETAEGLMRFIKHCEMDTYFIAAIAFRIQILGLSKQLTNLAGNSWARTLTGTRAERNEYILLHEFVRKGYIVPDKHHGSPNRRKDDHLIRDIETQGGDENGAGDPTTKKKDKFKGGLVFEPEKGLYDKHILVMDFNSLYPSIIQEFNICFTTVDRTACLYDEDKVPEVPERDQQQGVLPRLIATLVDRRRQVKKLLKDRNATPSQIAQWDIKQQALKLTANSMYGCLGYERSRFYARPLAILTTFKGREILTNTRELAESMGLRVIYGDTDSVMINTNADNYEEAMQIGQAFKKKVNEHYRKLEIDIDNVFERLLLHAKKKYAALNLVQMPDGKQQAIMEVKGLDMRRREFCQLSKEASTYVLGEILSGQETEVVVEHIHEYLRDLAEKARAGKYPIQKLVIYTKLSKDPKDYPNGKTMPQVQVALRKRAKGGTVSANDVISYIIAEGTEPVAERAYAEADFRKQELSLKPDYEWYLAKQFFPPIERLCAPISGTDAMHLAACLGLDTRKYQVSQSSGQGSSGWDHDKDLAPLASTVSDSERFKDCKRLQLSCGSCGVKTEFSGLRNSTDLCTKDGIVCEKCNAIFPSSRINAQVEHLIRSEITKYYYGWLVCDDASCGARTRQTAVYGRRCMGPTGLGGSCIGKMRYEYSDTALYTQLLYFEYLFDVDRARDASKEGAASLSEEKKWQIDALAEQNRIRFGKTKSMIDRYLENSARRYLDLRSIFAVAI